MRWDEKKPGYEVENELAISMGFTCVSDPRRDVLGTRWSSFVMGAWHVWTIVSHVPGKSNNEMRWQVARLTDGKYEKHYTSRPTEFGGHHIFRPGILELKDALALALENHRKETAV